MIKCAAKSTSSCAAARSRKVRRALSLSLNERASRDDALRGFTLRARARILTRADYGSAKRARIYMRVIRALAVAVVIKIEFLPERSIRITTTRELSARAINIALRRDKRGETAPNRDVARSPVLEEKSALPRQARATATPATWTLCRFDFLVVG